MARPNFDEIAQITRDLNYAYLQGYKRLISRDELLNLKGGGDLKLYETVAQDDQVKSCVQQRISAVISRDWGVEPGGEKKLDKQAAEFIEAELKNLQWDKICEKMLWGTFYGYSVAEIMWRRGDAIGIEDIKVRNRRRFNFGVDLQPKLITFEDPLGEDLPEQKFWHFCCGGDNDDDPYGMGLAHWLYWPTFFKRSDMRWWVTFLEKYAQPSRLGKYQPGASEGDKETLWSAMDAFGTNGKMLIPEGTAIELLEASRAGGADYQALMDICNQAISKIVLSQTMTTDDGSSQSQANVHQEVKDAVVKSDADLICSSFNNGPIKWLVDWNFPGAAYPKVWRQMDSEPDLTAEAERDSKLQSLGISLKPESIAAKYGDDYFVPERDSPQLAGEQVTALISIVTSATQGGWNPELVRGLIVSSFPGLSDDAVGSIVDNLGGDKSDDGGAEEPVDLDAAAAQFAAGKKKQCKAGISCGNACISAAPPICVAQDGDKQLAIQITDSDIKIKLYNPTAQFSQEPDTAEAIATNIQKIGDPIVGSWLRQIEQMLATSDDLESARESLFQLYPDLDGTELTEQMTDAMAVASMAGFWDAGTETGDAAEFAKIPEGTVRRRNGVDYTFIRSRWHRSELQSDRKLRPAEHIRRAAIDDMVSELEADLKRVDDRINASRDIDEIIELQRRDTTDAIGDKFIRDLMDINPREDAEKLASEIDTWESGDKTVREKTLTNAADFYQLIGKDLEIKKIDGGGHASRACANIATDSVSIPKSHKPSDRRRAQFHEMAHFTEFRDLESCQLAKDWVKSRSNSPPKPLSEICNNSAYDASEIAYEDNFIHPYIGKVYNINTNATEVHSMGLESFSNGHSLVKLFKQDREHFDLMIRYIAI